MFQHLVLLLITILASASGLKYNINFNPLNPYIDDVGERILQTDTTTTGTTQQPECTVTGDERLQCTVDRNVTEEDATIWTTLTANLNCALSPEAKNDFRRAKDCRCEASAVLMTQMGDPPVLDYRDCSCMLCPAGFGDFPFSINCDTPNQEGNPFILDECTSLDCGNNCNGTCVSGCEEPVAPECESLCEKTEPLELDPAGTSFQNSTSSGCTISGDRLLCSVVQNISEYPVQCGGRIKNATGGFPLPDSELCLGYLTTRVEANLDCAISLEAQKNFRRANDCKCDASVVEFRQGGDVIDSQMCSCTLCPAGLGDRPISVDCSNNLELGDGTDNLLGEDCIGLDCDGNCIGEFLTDLIKSQDDLSSLVSIISASRISAFWRDRTISDKFTVFAPTNEAFDNSQDLVLYTKYLAERPHWTIHLTVLLKFHTMEGLITSPDFTDGQVLFPFSDDDSSETFTVSLTAESGVDLILGENINEASVVEADLISENGVVHKVNQVLMPKALIKSLMESIAHYPVGLSKFREAIVTVGLEDVLTNDDVTVFAPTDDAFEVSQEVNLLTDPSQQDKLESILRNHIVEGVWHWKLFKDTRALTSLGGLQLRIDDSFQLVNDLHVELSDRVARNGILHIIQGVLVPPVTNLRGLMASQNDLSTFASAVSVNNTGVALGKEGGPYTLFAPTNEAIVENLLSEELVSRYLSEPSWLIHRQALFLFHTFHGLLSSANFTNGQILSPLLEYPGDIVRVYVDTDGIILSGEKCSSNLLEADLQAENGVLHKVDQLFVPKELSYNMKESFLEIDGRLAIFEQLVVIVGLEDSLSTQFVTLFGPVTNALKELGWDPEDIDIIDTGNEERVRTLILNHVVNGVYHREMLTPGLQLMSLAGHTLTIAESTNARQSLLVNDIAVDVFNKIASNGIAHVINGVLDPSDRVDVSLEPVTENPTEISSSSPYEEQVNATSSPTSEPTLSAEGSPTSSLHRPVKFRLTNLRMKLQNAGWLKTQQDIEAWERATENLYLRYYNKNRRRLDDGRRREARDVSTDIMFESQEVTTDVSGQSVNTITYDQSFEYTLLETESTEDLIPEDLVTAPLADEAVSESYEEELTETVPAFEGSNIGATFVPVIPATQSEKSGDDQVNTFLFIGMGFMALALFVACFFTRKLVRMSQQQLENTAHSKNLYGDSYYGDEDEDKNDALFMRNPVERDVQLPGSAMNFEHEMGQGFQSNTNYDREVGIEEDKDIKVAPHDFGSERIAGGNEMNQGDETNQVFGDSDSDDEEDESNESEESNESDDAFDTFLDER